MHGGDHSVAHPGFLRSLRCLRDAAVAPYPPPWASATAWFVIASVVALLAAGWGWQGSGSASRLLTVYERDGRLTLRAPPSPDATHRLKINVSHRLERQLRETTINLTINGSPAETVGLPLQSLRAELAEEIRTDTDWLAGRTGNSPDLAAHAAALVGSGRSSGTRVTPTGVAIRVIGDVAGLAMLAAPAIGVTRLARAAQFKRRLARFHDGLCPACAYDRAASPDRLCPECGRDPERLRREAIAALTPRRRTASA